MNNQIHRDIDTRNSPGAAIRGVPTPVTQFTSEIAATSELLDRLEKLLVQHSDRLRPICRSVPPSQCANGEKDAQALVPLAQSMRDQNVRLHSLIAAFETLASTVEC